ncbi:MAG: hypothetical protein JOY90_27660 [Bradyrhizobium sp.]|uniref:hypothetical protein n=1 Tax=Bradyrhizobium sp. TaxID=376 RepID=UPI001DB56B37|nr:hypothetical protein [Bradyrhizobium sp.]MBV9564190.1 hypothetical protein [Bradyrhizobium sp.]
MSRLMRFDARALRLLIIGSGLGWSVAFVLIALLHQLELYGDGAMFSYAVAVQDVWAFHWHNISGRSSVFLLSLLPAETIVGLTGKPWTGIIAYGFLFYVAPLVGLLLTFAADRSRGRFIFLGACGSTALLCPLIFGFPTEMCMAHALFWPVLAVCHYAKRTWSGAALVFFAELALAFTHEGALVLLAAIVATLAPRGLRDAAFVRAAISFIIVLALAFISKIVLPPDDYYAGVLRRAALHFFDPDIFKVEVVILSLASLAAYGIILAALSLVSPARASLYSVGILLAILSFYWLRFDHSVLASSRYYLRTALVIGTPILGAAAALAAMTGDGLVLARFAKLQHALTSPSDLTLRAWGGAFLVVLVIHVVETEKFVAAWTSYRAAIAALATGQASDPRLGDSRFVSSQRISPGLAPLAWFSTIPYLSVIATDFSPNRLVIDPAGNYFWLSCATATANRDAARVVPVEARELVRTYSCLHR